jgi:glutamate/tyrosine decarboxylase-like PLP-dependent enzyme
MERKGLAAELVVGTAPLELGPEEFRELGYRVIDRITEFLKSLPSKPVAPNESATSIRELISLPFPNEGESARRLLDHALDLLVDHSTFNGHPRFWGYITGSPAPIGALADLIAAALNPNLGKWILSPMGTEIEGQTVRWIAQMLGYPTDCGGLLVSGGSMANFVGFLAARRAKAPWPVRVSGAVDAKRGRLRVYTSAETHLWIQKAADLFGLGTDSIRWISTDEQFRMDPVALRKCIEEDLRHGELPFLVVGTAGSVSTGAVDPLPELAALCKEYGLWFHVDGAYGGFAAVLPEASADLRGLIEADSVAVDPHKWLYAPLEVGCALVRDPKALHDTFSYRPQYYHLVEDPAEKAINYYEYGPQNARGFRALKVWLCIRQAGREGYQRMIGDNIRLAEALYELVNERAELEALSYSLSITTFRYVPQDLKGIADAEPYLNQLNSELLTRLQVGGEVFLSNAMLRGKFALRTCIVNFRTSIEDIRALPELVVRLGAKIDATLRQRDSSI